MTPEQLSVFNSMSIIVEALIGLVHPDALKAEVEKVHQRRAEAKRQADLEADIRAKVESDLAAKAQAKANAATNAHVAPSVQRGIPDNYVVPADSDIPLEMITGKPAFATEQDVLDYARKNRKRGRR